MNGPGSSRSAYPSRIDVKPLYGSREKIFVRSTEGPFQRLRRYTVWPLLFTYFGTVWLEWGGRQAVLFDLPARQFHVFGLTFWPQDFWLLGWALIIAAFALFTVTTVVGRLWCGYTCPQTVWTAIFLWIEELTEGSRHRRIRLDAAPLGVEKVARRTLKHTLWLLVALATGVTFVAYFTPARSLVVDLIALNLEGWSAFWVLFFALATYVNAGWMREQVCIYMCPYARFQSAMIDRDTLIVSYDAARGEPRGRAKGDQSIGGDCVDCNICVQVCPTGIDIREGLQYECIGCAHCIDACDGVMEQVGRPSGLIRYTTEGQLQGETAHWLKPRALGYAAALCTVAGLFVAALLVRIPFELNVQRPRDALYRDLGGVIENSYRLTVLNKSQTPVPLELRVDSPIDVQLIGATTWTVEAGAVIDSPLRLKAAVEVPVTGMSFALCERDTDRCVVEPTSFLGPTS